MATIVVIKCPETDREVATRIITDLTRLNRLGDGEAATHCPIAINGISGRCGMRFSQ
jgi:hypothetical protein